MRKILRVLSCCMLKFPFDTYAYDKTVTEQNLYIKCSLEIIIGVYFVIDTEPKIQCSCIRERISL